MEKRESVCVCKRWSHEFAFGTGVVLRVNQVQRGLVTFAEATGGCKPVRLRDVEVSDEFSLSRCFSEQTPFIRFN